jgi:2-polyprenyl-6-methoxyphenol hydroxylase-like FAD-dependent oxidoreductase
MYVESGDLEAARNPGHFDVCIAGAGATGLAMAHRLIGSPLGDGGRVRRLLCASLRDGQTDRRFYVEADRYVLAMGGIETVRKLRLRYDSVPKGTP